MTDGLSLPNIETLLESLKYSKQRVRDASDTPDTVRLSKLAELEACEEQLRRIRDELATS